jgi:hypothetical protein
MAAKLMMSAYCFDPDRLSCCGRPGMPSCPEISPLMPEKAQYLPLGVEQMEKKVA